MVGGVEGGIHGVCGCRVAGVGDVVGRCCCGLICVWRVCHWWVVVGIRLSGQVVGLGWGRSLAVGGISGVWLGTLDGGRCEWRAGRQVGGGCVGWRLMGGGVF